MKNKRFAALALAALLLAALLAGCTFKAPATVGKVGDVEIPAGLYLLLQYNVYGRAEGLTTEEDVLKATLTVDEEEILGQDYLRRETLKAVENYAAVEILFAQLGGSLTEEELASAGGHAGTLWAGSQDKFSQNGIGLASLKLWMENSARAGKLLEMVYGPEGQQPVADAELTAFVDENYAHASYLALPLLDYSTYTVLDEEGDKQMNEIAGKIKAGLLAGEPIKELAAQYLPDAYALLNQSFDAANAEAAVGSLLAPASQLAQYGEQAQSDLLNAKPGDVVIVDAGMNRLVCQMQAVLGDGVTLEDLRTSALSEMKQEELDQTLAQIGEGQPHALDQSAMDRYSPKNIKP